MTRTVPHVFRTSAAVRRVAAASLRTAQPAGTPELVSLAMGEPGFDTPDHIRAAATAALAAGLTHYAHPAGDPQLRDAIAAQCNREHRTRWTTENVLVTHGGTGGLTAAVFALVDPGDRIVIADPTYSLYADLIRLAGGIPVPVPLAADLHLDPDVLADAVRDAQGLILCNPSNPTGVVHARAELELIAELLQDTTVWLLADEAYSALVYGDQPFTSVLDVDALRPRTLLCQTFSKAHAMTGWRVGYLAGDRETVAACARVHALTAGPVNTVVQRAALVALDSASTHGHVASMREEYRARRDLMVAGLEQVPGLHLTTPDGAFYAFPRYDADLTAVEMVAYLHAHGVAVRPGSEFGAAGERHLRLSFAADRRAITHGVERLHDAFTRLEHP
ncbi:pyridoxal phosphate-dependent aminotransferase [Jatrophihabitans sp. YIM 134969]